LVVDNGGKNQRANGFRRAERITVVEGEKLCELMPKIGDSPGPSLWWHLGNLRDEISPEDPTGWFDESEETFHKSTVGKTQVIPDGEGV
jgi:hypothetical protein